MSVPSKEIQQAETALESVIDRLIDSQQAFQHIAEELKDETLKRYLLAESLRRAGFRGEIESVLHLEGVHDVKESGTTAGKVHRAWAEIKSRLGGGDSSLLSAAAEGDDETVEAYEKAMDSFLPLPIRQLLTSQSAHIQTSRDYLKSARDPEKAS